MKKLKEAKGATGLGRSTSLATRSSGRPAIPERRSTVSYSSSSPSSPPGKKSHKSGRKNREEEDLQAAIAASLAESNPSSSSGPAYQLRDPPPPSKAGYNPSYFSETTTTAGKKPVPPAKDEEVDPDLAAAIAASLRDVAPPPSAPGEHDSSPRATTTYSSLYPSYPSYPSHSTTSAAPPRISSLPSYDLSPSESSLLHQFTSHLDRPPSVLSAHERDLYESARRTVPRLERGMEDAERRREILVEMDEKLGEAARLYRGLLVEKPGSFPPPPPSLSCGEKMVADLDWMGTSIRIRSKSLWTTGTFLPFLPFPITTLRPYSAVPELCRSGTGTTTNLRSTGTTADDLGSAFTTTCDTRLSASIPFSFPFFLQSRLL